MRQVLVIAVVVVLCALVQGKTSTRDKLETLKRKLQLKSKALSLSKKHDGQSSATTMFDGIPGLPNIEAFKRAKLYSKKDMEWLLKKLDSETVFSNLASLKEVEGKVNKIIEELKTLFNDHADDSDESVEAFKTALSTILARLFEVDTGVNEQFDALLARAVIAGTDVKDMINEPGCPTGADMPASLGCILGKLESLALAEEIRNSFSIAMLFVEGSGMEYCYGVYNLFENMENESDPELPGLGEVKKALGDVLECTEKNKQVFKNTINATAIAEKYGVLPMLLAIKTLYVHAEDQASQFIANVEFLKALYANPEGSGDDGSAAGESEEESSGDDGSTSDESEEESSDESSKPENPMGGGPGGSADDKERAMLKKLLERMVKKYMDADNRK
jgi:hypothetical protein